jgi:acyl carrier protein
MLYCMETKFIELFKTTLEIEEKEINLNTKFRDLENWDSLSFLSILAMIDEEYDVIIEGNDFRKLVTIEDLINEIKKKK